MFVTELISCTKCRSRLPESAFNAGLAVICPKCGAMARVELFPAFFQENLSVAGGENLLIESEAGCFYHPQKKAATVCDSCGRFICGLCDLELSGQHLCPVCLETGRKKKKIRNLEKERTLYDTMALGLAIAPILCWPITVLTAPVALYVVIRYWKAPGSLIPRSKARFIIAGLLALAQIVGWTIFIIYLVRR